MRRSAPPDRDFIRRRTTAVTLRDGTRVRIRPIVPQDKVNLTDGFRRLSPQSRYRRFLAPIDELTPEMLRQLTEIDYVDHFAYVAFVLDDGEELPAGVARYVRIPDDPEVAEAAVTVVDDLHRRGLGSVLLEALGAVALANGIRRFRAYALDTNQPLRDLAEHVGADIAHDAPGLVRLEVDLPERERAARREPLHRLFRALARGQPAWEIRLREFWTRLRAT
jgi:GNAT superfamily N-acetyltransferase